MQEALTRETILVVDDEPQVLVALEDLLSDEFVVLKSESAERALHVVQEQPDIAVVISDQRMPRMRGDELFKNLRGRFGAERILATGFADLTAVIRAVNEGQIFAYVTKPWDPGDLRVKIQRAADHFRLNRELEQERKLLEDLMNSIPDAIYFKDAELKFQRGNAALLRLLGRTDAASIIGRTFMELAEDPEHARATEEHERTLLRESATATDRISNHVLGGVRRWFSSTKAPIVDRGGSAVGLVAIARDVTNRVETEEALRNREEQLRLTFLASSAGLFDWDILSDKIEYSPSMAQMMAGDVAGTGFSELEARVHENDLGRLREAVNQHLVERTPLRAFELRVKDGDGYRWFEVSAQAVWDGQGKATRLVGSATDISDRKEQEARIRRLTRTHAVLSGINSAILRVHERKALLAESCHIAVRVGELALAIAASATGESGGPVLAWDGSSPDLVEAVSDWLIAESARTGSVVAQSIAVERPIVINDIDEQRAAVGDLASALLARGHVALAVLPVLVSGKVNCVLALFADQAGFFDADQLKLLAELADNIGFALEHGAQAQRLHFLAHHDELTGLANRRLLTERLSQQLSACRENGLKLAVVLIDIERFRNINETLGRRAGDEVLIEAARRVRAVTSDQWALARYANNTFAALIGPLENEAGVALWIEEMLGELAQSSIVSGTELRLAARVGISLFPSDGEEPDALFANAEAALKKAKVGAHRYLFYTSAMNGRVAERLTLETKLRSAVEHDEFLLHYQPKVELKTGRVVGLEALIRWQGKDGKLIPPGLFIPLLEETG
ncbi:MAG TPA: diguanylate cyclase, partial [Polyangiaceae bacterium]|nr:diguanylate cyclase [Polyangiaceae bacterium]